MSFKENNYQIITNFLDKNFVSFIQQYFFIRIKSGQCEFGDKQSPNSYCFYGDPLMETILHEAGDELGKIIGYSLLPTYSYTRLYGKGDELILHRDRPSCEISATISLAIPDGDKISPIYFSQTEDKSNPIEIKLNPGDLCIYKGCDLYHWREPFTHKWYLQSFLHYVDANGPHKDKIYDGRKFLSITK